MTIPEKKEQFPIRKFLSKGIFTQKFAISRSEFEKIALRGGRYILPGERGKVWRKEDIKKMISEDFPKEKFKKISKKDFEKKIESLAIEKYKAKTDREKKEIEHKIKFYRKKFLRGF